MPTPPPLPAAESLGDPQITTGDYQTWINDQLEYVRGIANELAALSGTTFREGAVRTVGTGADELPDKEILDTRLGTTGNLGTAAIRDVGTASGELVDNARLTVDINTSYGVAANGSNSITIADVSFGETSVTFDVRCVSDSSVQVIYGERSPGSGESGAYLETSFNNLRLVVVNGTPDVQQYSVAIHKIDFGA